MEILDFPGEGFGPGFSFSGLCTGHVPEARWRINDSCVWTAFAPCSGPLVSTKRRFSKTPLFACIFTYPLPPRPTLARQHANRCIFTNLFAFFANCMLFFHLLWPRSFSTTVSQNGSIGCLRASSSVVFYGAFDEIRPFFDHFCRYLRYLRRFSTFFGGLFWALVVTKINHA